MSSPGRAVWLRRVPEDEVVGRGASVVGRLLRIPPRPTYDVELWTDGALAHAERTQRPAAALVRRAGVARSDAPGVVGSADTASADWVTVLR